MFRRLAQILALVAMVASIVNAQCVFSCALAPKVSMAKPSHACCPENNSKQTPKNTCPDAGSHADLATVNGGVSLPIYAGSGILPALLPASHPLPELSFSGIVRSAHYPPGLNFRSTVSILRI